jgi:pimeloyl-ACP methyl ester carboxylesterase/DNA-binding winged helix-turn-helix (wHTH) protein
VRYRFADFELDLPQRELRLRGEPLQLQPQGFAFITALVEQRARVVSKRELSEILWPDAVVSEGSLQRVASLVRSALGPEGRALIRTFAGHGYRFVADVEELDDAPPPEPCWLAPRTHFVKSGDAHIAYRVLGEGDLDLVLVLGWAFPMQALSEIEEGRALLGELSALGRVVLFDKRGTGASDRVKELPTLAQRVDDLRAVLDEVGSERALLVGVSEGGPLSIAFSVLHPERVLGLVLVGAFPRMASAPDYPYGWKVSELGQLKQYMRTRWGEGATMLALVPASARRPELEAWARTTETNGASPGAALDLLEMNLSIDVRSELPQLRVPTLVLHARGDQVVAHQNGTYLAEHIAQAELLLVDGDDHTFLFLRRRELVAGLRGLLTRSQSD